MLQKHKSYFFGLQTYRQHNVLNIIWFSVWTENSKKSSNATRILVLILVSVLYPIGFSRNLQIPLGYQYLLYSFLFGKNPWAPPLSFPIVQNCWSGCQNGIKWTSWSSVQIQDSFLCQSCPTCRARDRELKRTKVKSVWEICQLTTKNTNRRNVVVAWLPSSCPGSHCPSLRFVGLSSSLWPCLNTEDHEEAVPLMSSYLTDNILQRARWAAHVNHILQLHSPGGQEGGHQFSSIHLRNLNLFFWKWYAGGKPRSRRDFGWRMQNLYGIPRFQLDREKVKSNHWTSHNTDRTTPCSKKER